MSQIYTQFEEYAEGISLATDERAKMLASLRAHQARHPLSPLKSPYSIFNLSQFTRLSALAFALLISFGAVSYVTNQNGVLIPGTTQSIIMPNNNPPASTVDNRTSGVAPANARQKSFSPSVAPLSDKSINATPSFIMMRMIISTTSTTSNATTTEATTAATSTLK